jgi:hypothetical protein
MGCLSFGFGVEAGLMCEIEGLCTLCGRCLAGGCPGRLSVGVSRGLGQPLFYELGSL